ncbi:MAG: CAP domain-containing protein [Dehalococcoidia bacterium]|nr:CAP domain-containing protein [Dehalococcoidia bacterium]
MKASRLVLVFAGMLSLLAMASCNVTIGPTTVSDSGTSAVPTTSSTTFPPLPTGTTTPRIATTARPTTTTTKTPQQSHQDAQLVQYVLGLINKDRADFGHAPVTLGTNQAAQQHADDMFAGYFLSHWGTDGLKPYMRYTQAGGDNYEGENSAYAGWYDPADDPNRWATIDAQSELQQLEYAMMYDDAPSNWGHKDNILNPWHKKVNIGITYDNHRLAFVEQFEGDYVQFTQLPATAGSTLSMSGTATLGNIDSVGIFYDPPPQPLTNQQLVNGPHSYSLGDQVGFVYAPPPPGYFYTTLPPNAVQASRWSVNSGVFNIQADLSLALRRGPGVYTVVIVTKAGTEMLPVTNYSIFVQ